MKYETFILIDKLLEKNVERLKKDHKQMQTDIRKQIANYIKRHNGLSPLDLNERWMPMNDIEEELREASLALQDFRSSDIRV